MIIFWYHTCRPHSFKSLPIQKTACGQERLIRYSVNIPLSNASIKLLEQDNFFSPKYASIFSEKSIILVPLLKLINTCKPGFTKKSF